MNVFFVNVRSFSIVSGVLQFVVEVKGTDGTNSVDGYNFNTPTTLTSAQLNDGLLNQIKGDFGVSGDRFLLLGGGVAEAIK